MMQLEQLAAGLIADHRFGYRDALPTLTGLLSGGGSSFLALVLLAAVLFGRSLQVLSRQGAILLSCGGRVTWLRCITLRCITLRCITLRCITLRCITLRCITLR